MLKSEEYVDDTADSSHASMLAIILSRLVRIEAKLGDEASPIAAQEAVSQYKKHIRLQHRRPNNLDYLLSQFEAAFMGRNMADITPAEAEGFVRSTWGARNPSTIERRKSQLSSFFSFSINELKRNGSPAFNNPCNLIQRIKVRPIARVGFIPVEKMKEFLETFKEEKHWLMISILMASGLRVGELLKLRPKDVSGRVLTLITPKSGRDIEHAIIPEEISGRLLTYMRSLNREAQIFKINPTAVNRLIGRHARMVGLELTCHGLRRWCATFYERNGDMSMVRFILRHSSVRDSAGNVIMDPLTGRYVAALSVKEAMERQAEFNEISKDLVK